MHLSNEFAAQLTEALANRLFAELTKLHAPTDVVELLYGLEFFALYQTGRHNMDADVPAVLESTLTILGKL